MTTKATTRKKRTIPDDPTVSPLYWFVTFHEATLDREVTVAANAQLRLRELGYEVRVVRKRGEV